MKPILLRRRDLACNTAQVLNRLGRRVGRIEKAFVIETTDGGHRTKFEIHYPGVERADVLAILRLLLQDYRTDSITPIMIEQERGDPSLGARAT